MKKAILAVAVIVSALASVTSWADVYVNGYTRSNGTYVEPYVRSAPDGNLYNNYSYGR